MTIMDSQRLWTTETGPVEQPRDERQARAQEQAHEKPPEQLRDDDARMDEESPAPQVRSEGEIPRIKEDSDSSAIAEKMSGRVLMVDDDEGMCRLAQTALTRRGFDFEWRTSAEEALQFLDHDDVDVVITDLAMNGMDGLELCERVAKKRPDLPVIVMTAYGSMKAAIGAIRAGAHDFVTKPVDMDALAHTLGRTIQHQLLHAEVRRLREQAAQAERFDEMVGTSPTMRKVYDLISRVASTEASVLITGESGTGKELVARALHKRSERANGPFIAINCAAMPATLLESELFGHVKGAFTDARASRDGLFVQASNGTIFLDEIGELPVELQPKLLRALQERRVRPLGSTQEVQFDARIIAATNRDLEAEVEIGKFRQDLFYRINVVRIPVPPLRSRGNDILLLAQRFLEKFAARSGKPIKGISSAAADRLLSYDWAGNVRELENCMERAVALTRFEEVTVDDLPDNVRDYKSSNLVVAGDDPAQLLPLKELERRYIHRVLKACGGNKSEAARVLGLDRRTLYRKLERYGDHEAHSSNGVSTATN